MTMHLVEFTADSLRFVETPPEAAPEHGFLWIFLGRDELSGAWPLLQQAAQCIGGSPLLDLHCRDLANASHDSYYDYTSVYDLVIFRRLVTQQEIALGLDHGGNGSDLAGNGDDKDAETLAAEPSASVSHAAHHHGAVFERIRSLATGFAVYDRLLISVHPKGCRGGDAIIRRLLEDAKQGSDINTARSRLPSSPADLALRMINEMVDGYLEIRRELGTQIKVWQTELLNAHSRFTHWNALMNARSQLHALEDLCDEQHDAIQEWLDALREQPLDAFDADPLHHHGLAGGVRPERRDALLLREQFAQPRIERFGGLPGHRIVGRDGAALFDDLARGVEPRDAVETGAVEILLHVGDVLLERRRNCFESHGLLLAELVSDELSEPIAAGRP